MIEIIDENKDDVEAIQRRNIIAYLKGSKFQKDSQGWYKHTKINPDHMIIASVKVSITSRVLIVSFLMSAYGITMITEIPVRKAGLEIKDILSNYIPLSSFARGEFRVGNVASSVINSYQAQKGKTSKDGQYPQEMAVLDFSFDMAHSPFLMSYFDLVDVLILADLYLKDAEMFIANLDTRTTMNITNISSFKHVRENMRKRLRITSSAVTLKRR